MNSNETNPSDRRSVLIEICKNQIEDYERHKKPSVEQEDNNKAGRSRPLHREVKSNRKVEKNKPKSLSPSSTIRNSTPNLKRPLQVNNTKGKKTPRTLPSLKTASMLRGLEPVKIVAGELRDKVRYVLVNFGSVEEEVWVPLKQVKKEFPQIVVKFYYTVSKWFMDDDAEAFEDGCSFDLLKRSSF